MDIKSSLEQWDSRLRLFKQISIKYEFVKVNMQ